MNNLDVFAQKQAKRKFPFGAIIILAAQALSLGSLIAQKIVDANSTMYSAGAFEMMTVTRMYVGPEFWMGMLLLIAIAVLSIIGKHKLLNVILICELGIAAFVNFAQVLTWAIQMKDYSYYGYIDAAIWDFVYLLLVSTVVLFALRDFGVSAIKISNKVIFIASCVSVILCLYIGGVIFINSCDMLEFDRDIYSAFANLSSVITSVGLFLLGERIANPYNKRGTRVADASESTNDVDEA